MRRLVSGLLAGMLVSLAVALPAAAASLADDPFVKTWVRTDLPVATGSAYRTWMWGPQAFTAPLMEDYIEAPGGQRQVQYFDKARMEINNPAADPNTDWYVTNGLLAKELITGEMQVGDATFEQHDPAQVNMAGDPDDPWAPTYATFSGLLQADAHQPGHEIAEQILREGRVAMSHAFVAYYNVKIAAYVPETDHGIAEPFWNFMIATGTVYENGMHQEGRLFKNPFYGTGFPITEPYWTTVKVNADSKHVLVQCFERRCLTYTPSNPEGWQVEAGNVGQHYYIWRYGSLPADAPDAALDGTSWTLTALNGTAVTTDPAPTLSFEQGRLGGTAVCNSYDSAYVATAEGDIWIPSIRQTAVGCAGDGNAREQAYLTAFRASVRYRITGDLLELADASGTWHLSYRREETPTLSRPDPVPPGRILFRSDRDYAPELYAINPDGTNLINLSNAPGWDIGGIWSPDATRIAFTSERDGNNEIYVMNADGSDPRNITQNPAWDGAIAWSPDGSRILFQTERDGNNIADELYVMNADGLGQTLLSKAAGGAEWSPDGTRIAFVLATGASIYEQSDIVLMDADGSNLVNLTNQPARYSWLSWSPDGTRIAFQSDRDGDDDIYVVRVDGSGVSQLTNDPAGDRQPDWSPDGSKIAFEAERNNETAIYIMNPDGSDQIGLTSNGSTSWCRPCSWSPDSSYIAYQSNLNAEFGGYDVFIVEVATHSVWQVTTRGDGSDSVWSPR